MVTLGRGGAKLGRGEATVACRFGGRSTYIGGARGWGERGWGKRVGWDSYSGVCNHLF